LEPTFRPGVERIYPVCERFTQSCLRADRSLFQPDKEVWTQSTAQDCHDRFVNADKTSGSFIEQYRTQLIGAPEQTVLYAAEIFYLYLLIVVPSAISGTKKRELVAETLSWLEAPIALDEELDSALDFGLVNPGTFYLSARHRQISHMAQFSLKWKTLAEPQRKAALDGPWTFRTVLYEDEQPGDGGGAQRRALLHIVHPDKFEAITSPAHAAVAV